MNFRKSIDRLLTPLTLAVNLFLIGIVFQVLIITKFTPLYLVLKVLFAAFLILLLAYVVKASARDKAVALIILAIVLVRVPFLVHPNGLMTMSDNALEALQSQEIQDARSAPFFQFEVLKHQGTLRYLLISEIWDVTGPHYLVMTLWNLLIFAAIILLLFRLLAQAAPLRLGLLLSVLSFAFIETMFDFSLLIRGGIYLDALLLPLLGMALFDFEYGRKLQIVLAYYFMFLAVYIQPIGAFFAAAFILCAILFSIIKKRFWANAGLLAIGAALGSFHQVYYYLFFKAAPVSTGAYERVGLIPLSRVSLRLFGVLVRNFETAFSNLFRYETSYFIASNPGSPGNSLWAVIAAVCMYISLGVFIAGIVLALIKIVRGIARKPALAVGDWPYLFFLALLAGVLVKLVALQPARLEPRHSLDLLLLIMMSYFFALGPLFKSAKRAGLKAGAAALLLVIFAVPHYYFFLKNAVDKDKSYAELMAALRASKVRYLVTDFNLAYPVYFLSHRTIAVSDTIGPLTLRFFYPELKSEVDNRPDSEKAFLFYSDASGTRAWHKRATARLRARTIDRLKAEGLPYKTVNLRDYTLIVPEKSRSAVGAGEGPR